MASTHSIISAVQRKTTDGDEAEERDVAEKTQTPEETARERIEEARRSGATALHLSGLGLTELPDTIGQLTALQTLNLSSNRLTALPDTISQLSALTQLYLSGNQLAALPDTIGQLSALTVLDLSDNQLTALPDTIGQFSALTELYLSGNQLAALPDTIGQLTALTVLGLISNRLTALPDTIGQLSALTVLYLFDNQLTALPDTIGQLTALTELNLCRNQLTTLPSTIGQLTALTRLDLRHNQFTVLPVTIGQFPALMLLGLGSNQLTALPATIGQLTALKYLYIDDNPLTTLPDTIGQLVNLRQLYLHGNPHLGIPDEVLGPRWQEVGEDIRPADPHKILDYYFRTRQGERPLNEGRLILVGRGGAGKTSLVKRLVLDEFDPDEKQTDGINITQWPIDCPAGDKIRLHLWDFGGQEILHALHRFFLSERALYLLVVTGREGAADGDVEYWMQHIDTFGPSSPVIVVLNKCASCPVELERRRLQAKYPQIRAFVETDCDTRAGLDTLKTEITAAIDGMEEVRKKFPAGWFGIKDTLSGMAEPYISLKRYQEICAENNETEPQAQEDLAYFLHCLGIALHFPEEQLRETSVLSPHWVTGGVYGILTAEAIRRNGGLTDARALGGILPESYGGKQAFLLELMRKFQLCLPFGDGHRFLIPELLPKDEPADLPVFPVEEGLGFAYHYALLPEGVLPEFIVRSYVLSEGGQRWRNGVVLAWEGCRALVRADIFDGRVSIRIIDGDAEARRRLLGVIRADFETIHQGLKLKPAAFVPVPGHPAATPISYDDLCAFEQSRVETYHHNIDGKVIPLTVADLLNGVDPSPAGRLIGDPARSSLPRVFISYAHKDERLRAELDPHLKWLKRQGIIDYWYDRMIHPGERWDDRIKRELDSAQIVLFFVSTDFLASDYIYEQEIPLALARQEAGKAIGISVILRAVHNFKNCPLAPFQAVNDPERPIKSMSSAERDKAWVQVEAAIQTAAARTGR